jgi:hypothetical protein
MLPVVYALLAYVVSMFRSREALRLENMALRHKVSPYRCMRRRDPPPHKSAWQHWKSLTRCARS